MTTAEELEKLSSGERHELVNGELIAMTPSVFDHGAIIVNLTVPLASHVKSSHLGVVVGAETGFKLASQPDTAARRTSASFAATD
jgi:Uma2 family endonuclease